MQYSISLGCLRTWPATSIKLIDSMAQTGIRGVISRYLVTYSTPIERLNELAWFVQS